MSDSQSRFIGILIELAVGTLFIGRRGSDASHGTEKPLLAIERFFWFVPMRDWQGTHWGHCPHASAAIYS